MSTDLLKLQSLHDFIKTFIIYQICVFVMVNCLLLRLKFRECISQKCYVNFQNSLCHHSENRLTRIFYVSSCVTPLRACVTSFNVCSNATVRPKVNIFI